MHIELGKDVYASDGEKLGTVDRLVLDNETHDLRKFVVHKGFIFSEDRIVDVELVTGVDDDGSLRLSVPSTDDRTIPPFVEETFRVASDEEARHLGYGSYMNTAPWAPIWYAPGGATGSYRPGEGPFFHGAETTSGTLETQDNLPDDSISIDTGTDVIGSDGDKVGEVEEVLTDANGQVSGFVVKAGFIFTHDVQIPMSAVDGMSLDHIRLNITSDEAEDRYKVS